MKTKAITIICTLLLIGINAIGQSTPPEAQITELRALALEGKVYINMSAMNEVETGVYSLIRRYADGSFESVGIKDAHPNQLNQPLLYSFRDNEVPEEDVRYELIRINYKDNPLIASWTYDAQTASISLDQTNHFASAKFSYTEESDH